MNDAQGINLFIVDGNPLLVKGLQNFLERRFGTKLKISTFSTGENALKSITNDTNIVILDYFILGENGNDVQEKIKKINPKTEVLMLSSDENIGIAIDSFLKGENNYVTKSENVKKKVPSLFYKIITYPAMVIAGEFGIHSFSAHFKKN